MKKLGVSSKLNADWGALTDLRDRGRERADEWLDGQLRRHRQALDRRHPRTLSLIVPGAASLRSPA